MIDMDKVLTANPARVDDLNRQLDKAKVRFALSEFLTDKEKNTRTFRKYSAALTDSTRSVLNEELYKVQNMDVDECIKTTVDYQVYIPGSSIKGALRTALAYSTFQSDNGLLNTLKQRLTKIDWHNSDKAVNELIFWGARNDPRYDLLKTLWISDSTTLPASEETLEVGEMKILSLGAPGKQTEPKGTMSAQLQALNLDVSEQNPMKQGWAIQEILKPGARVVGTVYLEERLLRQPNASKVLGWSLRQQNLSIERLIQAANAFAKDICDWELNFFDTQVRGIDVGPVLDFYRDLKSRIDKADEYTCYLCIGQGAGWHKMTIGLLLQSDQRFNFKVLRKELRLAQDRLDFDYPKSRKLLMKSGKEIQAVYGWVELQIDHN